MRVERSAPGEELAADGSVAVPRQAATVILVRDEAASLELLLVRRTPYARFMGGVWVFPGGAVDAHEGEGEASHRHAAVRELREEAGIGGVDPDSLVRFSRWITPSRVAIRYDTHFFIARLPAGARPRIDGSEIVDYGWFRPARALDAHRRGELELVFPTIKHLEQLALFPSASALLAHARGRKVEAVEPRVLLEGEIARIVLPGEPGYEAS